MRINIFVTLFVALVINNVYAQEENSNYYYDAAITISDKYRQTFWVGEEVS